MGLALFQERRMAGRRKLTGLLPGRLVLAESSTAISCRPVDVSVHGIGIVVTGEVKNLPIGTKLKLITPQEEIALTISWMTPDFGKQSSSRYGVVTDDPTANLEVLFQPYGCLR